MLFENIKKSFLKSVQESGSSENQKPKLGRRIQDRFTNICYSVYNVKNVFSAYRTVKAAYDPYQMKQYASESGFDPYCDEAPKGVKNIDAYYDANDCFFDECLPAAKRIRIMATSAIDSAAHTIAWGAVAAVHFVYTSVPLTNSPPTGLISATPIDDATFAKANADFASNMNSKKKKETITMRGFGVDFAAVVERSPEMKKSMENVERQIRVLCLEDNEAIQQEADRKRIVSCGGDQRTSLKRSIEDTWGFVERDYSITFKSTMAPPKPPRRVYIQPTQLRREIM
ncbi:unnamed protein product [Mucor hiemalis]